MEPLFSIITVTYNAAATLVLTMKSVGEQTFHDYEHLIIDGASSDATLEVAETLESERTIIMSERDKGIYDAMNKGLALARGKYLIFLNAGDKFHCADTLEMIAECIVKYSYPGVVYGQTDIVDADGRRLGARHLTAPEHLTADDFSRGMLVCHQAFVVRADIAPRYDMSYRFSADYDWCIKCLRQSPSNQYIPQVLIDYLNEGVTTANHRKSLLERFSIMRKHYGLAVAVLRHVSFVPRFLAAKFRKK